MQGRLDEAESMGAKGGKRALSKLESRIHELEQELDQVFCFLVARSRYLFLGVTSTCRHPKELPK